MSSLQRLQAMSKWTPLEFIADRISRGFTSALQEELNFMVRAIGRPTLRPAPLPDWIARAAARAACRSDQREKTAGWRQRRAQLSERPQTLVLQMPPPGSPLSRRHRPGCKERTGADSMNALLVCVWTANHPRCSAGGVPRPGGGQDKC